MEEKSRRRASSSGIWSRNGSFRVRLHSEAMRTQTQRVCCAAGRTEKKKNASRFRACSTTPLQSILRESRREKMARDTESILSVFDFYLSTFVFCKPISQILSKKVVKVFIHGKIKYREKNLSLLSSCN